jgi:hypothetical protein
VNTEVRFNQPFGLAIDGATNLYVADNGNQTIRMISPVGTNWVVSTLAGMPGERGRTDGLGATARFNAPNGITIDTLGALYVADTGNHLIRKLTLTQDGWVASTVAGGAGPLGYGSLDGTNGTASFFYPARVAVSGAGVVFVADQVNCLIRRITPVGSDWVVTTIGGGTNAVSRPEDSRNKGFKDGIGRNALFNLPRGIALDALGNVYVADPGNNTIRQGSPLEAPHLSLQLTSATGQISLSWPGWMSNYVIETSSQVTESIPWIPITNLPTLAGSNVTLDLSTSGPAAFYRLRMLAN